MWTYQEKIEELFDEYVPEKSPYALLIDVTSKMLTASNGDETWELTDDNGNYKIKVHVFPEKGAPSTTTKSFTNEEEALLYWMRALEIKLSADRKTKKRVTDFCNYLYGIIKRSKKRTDR